MYNNTFDTCIYFWYFGIIMSDSIPAAPEVTPEVKPESKPEEASAPAIPVATDASKAEKKKKKNKKNVRIYTMFIL